MLRSDFELGWFSRTTHFTRFKLRNSKLQEMPEISAMTYIQMLNMVYATLKHSRNETVQRIGISRRRFEQLCVCKQWSICLFVVRTKRFSDNALGSKHFSISALCKLRPPVALSHRCICVSVSGKQTRENACTQLFCIAWVSVNQFDISRGMFYVWKGWNKLRRPRAYFEKSDLPNNRNQVSKNSCYMTCKFRRGNSAWQGLKRIDMDILAVTDLLVQPVEISI